MKTGLLFVLTLAVISCNDSDPGYKAKEKYQQSKPASAVKVAKDTSAKKR